MAEQRADNTQQVMVIGLVVIAVLLASIVGIMLYQRNTAIPGPDANAAAQQTQQSAGTPMGGTGGTGAQAAPAKIDPKKAVKLPGGTTPKQWVTEYYTATDKGDFAAAVKHLPADKQASTTPQALKEQLAGYGIVGFSVVNAAEQGDTATVIVDQKTQQFGTFENTWTFKKINGEWAVVNKAVTGMKQ